MTRFTRALSSTLLVAIPAMAQQQQTRRTTPPPKVAAPAKPVEPPPTVPGKPALTHADYGKWETLGNATLSPDGKWFAYTLTRVAGGNELRYRPVAQDSVRIVRGASNPTFTEDGRWLIYSVNPAAE